MQLKHYTRDEVEVVRPVSLCLESLTIAKTLCVEVTKLWVDANVQQSMASCLEQLTVVGVTHSA